MNDDDTVFGYELSGEEMRGLIVTPPDQRLTYFVDKCAETGQVWTIGAGEELIVLADDSDEPFVVVFPHPEFGQDWFSTTELDEVDLVAISTQDWASEVLPGLEEAGVRILVFPTSEGDGLMIGSGDLAKLQSPEL
ncbi:MAG TPA: DUF2750 domain-containing protein [Fimbriimonadaceae bacterium]|nr:DUF2750 domain-containing protein [Fimbriimonadaceae bacterium]